MMSLPVWLPGPVFLLGGGLCPEGSMSRVCLCPQGSLFGGVLCPGDLCLGVSEIRKVGGTHPTGMLSCY